MTWSTSIYLWRWRVVLCRRLDARIQIDGVSRMPMGYKWDQVFSVCFAEGRLRCRPVLNP